MKSSLGFTLEGRDWWRLYLPFWIMYVALTVIIQLSGSSSAWGKAHTGLSLLLQLGLFLVLYIVIWIFTILFLRMVAPKLSYQGEGFAFRGKVGEYIWLNVVGCLLSVVTIFIFTPWYARRVADYLASNTSWRGTDLKFLGRGGRLFVFMLIGFWAPLIALVVVIVLSVGVHAQAMQPGGAPQLITMLVTFGFVLYIMAVFLYLVYKWLVDISWKDIRVRWKTKFWPSFGMVVGQGLLTLITLTVYWPAAYKKLYRYFTERTALSRGDVEFGHMGFEGQKGFGLLWGQTLLSIITIGFYAPWAYARVGRWLIGGTIVERTDR